MKEWKDIRLEGVSRIDKCVAEFDVWAIPKVPYAKFKVKVFESSDGCFTGYTNLLIKSTLDGSPEGGIGHGSTISEALEDTLQYFMKQIEDKGGNLTEEDIEYSDPDDF